MSQACDDLAVMTDELSGSLPLPFVPVSFGTVSTI